MSKKRMKITIKLYKPSISSHLGMICFIFFLPSFTQRKKNPRHFWRPTCEMISRPIFMQFCKPLQHILLQGATKLVCYCIVQGLLLTTGRCGQLKPRQNKKGQSFVVMLDFFMSFFEFASAACSKKKCKSQESEQIFSCSYFVGTLSNMQLFKLLFY